MANGSRTLLLSRWRTGGQTSFDLVREFIQELPNDSAADAWQRAVLLAMDSRVNFTAEPRVKRTPTDEAPKASHPFFWAGYMLVDSGAVPRESDEEPNEPVIKIKPPKPPEKGKAKGKAEDKPKNEVKEETKGEVKDKPKKDLKSKPKTKAKEKPKDEADG